jgi:hypothetical protein
MLLTGLFAVILAWPVPEAQAVRLAGELGADALLIMQPGSQAPSRTGSMRVLAEVPATAAAVAAARRAGYDGAAVAAIGTEKEFRGFLDSQNGFVRYVFLKAEQLSWDVRPAHAVLAAGQWPGVQPAAPGEASATERPWLVGNQHLFAYLRGHYPSRPAVLRYAPGEKSVRYEGAEIALAEAFAGGGEVVLELPEMLRAGLAREDGRAKAAWQRLRQVADFLKSQSGLARTGGGSGVGIVAGPLEAEIEEMMNLSYRNNLSSEVLPAGRLRLEGRRLRVVAAANLTLSAADTAALASFARGGGIVVTAPAADAEPEASVGAWGKDARKLRTEGNREVWAVGRGTIYSYREPFYNPADFAAELRETAGLDNPEKRGLHGLDLRVWNSSTVLGTLHLAPDGRLAVLVSYGRWADQEFLVGIRGAVQAGAGVQPEKPNQALQLMRRPGRRVEWNQEGLNRVGVFTLKETGP